MAPVNPQNVPEKIRMQDGDAILVMVKDGKVVHFSPNMSLPHVEFVRRYSGQKPEGAWVGTVSKLDGVVMGISSKYFYDCQLPAPEDVNEAIKESLELQFICAHMYGLTLFLSSFAGLVIPQRRRGRRD